jgi:hypothetical protein
MLRILPKVSAYKLWLAWIVTAVALLVAKPWGAFSWSEWLAVALPLLLMHPAVGRRVVLIIGLVVITPVWMALGDQSGGWPELACLWVVLAIGTVIGFAATRAVSDEQLQQGALPPSINVNPFFDALNRELCRARRDESTFAVLSVDRHAEHPSDSLHRVCELLNTELRAYADIAHIGDRVLVLVPNVLDDQYLPLLKRLTTRAAASDCGEIRIGLARFPQDAACVQDLINSADNARLERGIYRIPHASSVNAQDQAAS